MKANTTIRQKQLPLVDPRPELESREVRVERLLSGTLRDQVMRGIDLTFSPAAQRRAEALERSEPR